MYTKPRFVCHVTKSRLGGQVHIDLEVQVIVVNNGHLLERMSVSTISVFLKPEERLALSHDSDRFRRSLWGSGGRWFCNRSLT